jgi:hypothetical protein
MIGIIYKIVLQWFKLGADKASPKVSYIVLVPHGDKSYVVGSGMYDVTLEDIKNQFPNYPIYEE